MTAARPLEWARVAPGEVVVATTTGARLHRPDPFDPHDPFAAPMTGPGHPDTTRWLLDGALGAGQRAARAASTAAPPPLTADRWAWRLAGYYHLTTHTPRLLAEAEVRFAAAGRAELAAWAADRRREETGHDRLALRDLTALGFDAERAVAALRPPTAITMVDYFTQCVYTAAVPVRVIGYAHTVERLASTFDRAYLDSVVAVLPAGVDATRCLRVHSALGSDADHAEDNVRLVASLPAFERIEVSLACRECAELCWRAPTEGHLEPERLRDLLMPVRSSPEGG